MSNHNIKCITPFFEDVLSGHKTFEIRKDDRNYKTGDHVRLEHYFPLSRLYNGEHIEIIITYLIRGTVCLKEGYCAFGFVKVN